MIAYACTILLPLVLSGVMSAGYIIGIKAWLGGTKLSPFECGFSPLGRAREGFSMQFFSTALVFLVFDVELVLLFPFVMKSPNTELMVEGFTLMVFVLILVGGLFLEWKNKLLEWEK